jgi:hypothetical protein
MAAGINDTFRQVGIAVGIAVWGAVFIGRGADKVEGLVAGTPVASGQRPRELVEAASSGSLDQALAALPAQVRPVAASAAGEGFLAGLNNVLTLGVLLSFAGAVLALWLVREREIERQPPQPVRALELEAPARLVPAKARAQPAKRDRRVAATGAAVAVRALPADAATRATQHLWRTRCAGS